MTDRKLKFQSAPPAWGAIKCSRGFQVGSVFQSAPPAWGAIHIVCLLDHLFTFQSAPPAWGAISNRSIPALIPDVSIRAPRVGGDQKGLSFLHSIRSFNPRPPRGGRSSRPPRQVRPIKFQSAPPAWGAITSMSAEGLYPDVSIRAPRVGGDGR